MTVLRYASELVVVTCWCGTTHAVPKELHDHQERCHREGLDVPDIWCPLGHRWVPAGKSEVARLTSEVAKLDQSLAGEKARHAATKGELTKLRKRAARGVCPCCNRSFVDVARHVATRHPEALT